MHVIFEGRAAKRLWNNVKDSLELLNEAHERRRRDDIKGSDDAMRTFVWTCYAGHDAAQTQQDFTEIDSIDREFYRLATISDQLSVELKLDDEVKVLNFGHVVGRSVVIALSEDGYSAYIQNRIPGFKLVQNPDYVLRAALNRRQTEYVYIGSVVHIPSLRRLFSCDNEITQPVVDPVATYEEAREGLDKLSSDRKIARVGEYQGLETMELMYQQIRKLIVPMEISEGKLRTPPTYRPPVIFCPISGHGEGAFLAIKAGFWPSDRDTRGYLRYKLDFGRYNGAAVGKYERMHIRRAVKFLGKD